jgi:hypothetical protein
MYAYNQFCTRVPCLRATTYNAIVRTTVVEGCFVIVYAVLLFQMRERLFKKSKDDNDKLTRLQAQLKNIEADSEQQRRVSVSLLHLTSLRIW